MVDHCPGFAWQAAGEEGSPASTNELCGIVGGRRAGARQVAPGCPRIVEVRADAGQEHDAPGSSRGGGAAVHIDQPGLNLAAPDPVEVLNRLEGKQRAGWGNAGHGHVQLQEVSGVPELEGVHHGLLDGEVHPDGGKRAVQADDHRSRCRPPLPVVRIDLMAPILRPGTRRPRPGLRVTGAQVRRQMGADCLAKLSPGAGREGGHRRRQEAGLTARKLAGVLGLLPGRGPRGGSRGVSTVQPQDELPAL